MDNSVSLNLNINPSVRRRAEEVLSSLGMSMSTAVDIYLTQISLTGGIPFAVTIPQAPSELNMDLMSDADLSAKLSQGLAQAKAGTAVNASEAFAEARKKLNG